jgi:hypothetical protein
MNWYTILITSLSIIGHCAMLVFPCYLANSFVQTESEPPGILRQIKFYFNGLLASAVITFGIDNGAIGFHHRLSANTEISFFLTIYASIILGLAEAVRKDKKMTPSERGNKMKQDELDRGRNRHSVDF